MSSPHKHRKYDNFGITLNTGSEIISPIENEKLLGAQISNNFTWNQHIRDHEKSMFRILVGKLNALKKICPVANFKTRRMIATGLVMSSLTYIVQAYGSCSEYLLNMLQIQQNIAARLVTKLPWFTSTSTLLMQCGWLSVRQLVKYHSLTLLFKIVQKNTPVNLYSKIDKPI